MTYRPNFRIAATFAVPLLALLVAVSFAPLRAVAAPLAKPVGDVVLSIDGAVAATNADGKAEFDMALIEQLPKVEIATRTPWTEGASRFAGVRLSDLLAAAGANGKQLTAIALNDYAVTMPIDEAIAADAFIAYALNGEAMSPREKGPLWVMFPFDDRPELKTEVTYSRCIWQLVHLTVLP